MREGFTCSLEWINVRNEINTEIIKIPVCVCVCVSKT